MSKGIRVYWVNSDSAATIGSDVAVAVTKDRVTFADGGWNPLADTYLTASQARKAKRLPEPVPKLRKVAERAYRLMESICEQLDEALEESKPTGV